MEVPNIKKTEKNLRISVGVGTEKTKMDANHNLDHANNDDDDDAGDEEEEEHQRVGFKAIKIAWHFDLPTKFPLQTNYPDCPPTQPRDHDLHSTIYTARATQHDLHSTGYTARSTQHDLQWGTDKLDNIVALNRFIHLNCLTNFQFMPFFPSLQGL